MHELAYKLADKINIYIHKEGIEKVKLQYGMEMILLNASKLIVIIIIAALLGIIPQMLITLLSFNIIRNKAFGLHARSSVGCMIGSILLFIVCVYFANMIEISNVLIVSSFSVFAILMALYAPSDTEKRPLIGVKMRERLRKKSVITVFVVMTIALLIPYGNIKTLILLGALIEMIMVLPLTYKILQRRRNNYEEYEQVA